MSAVIGLDEALALPREGARDIVNVDAPTRKMVVFELAGDVFAIAGSAVAEILSYTTVYPVPGCPETMEGAINLRGEIESVIRLARLLGREDQPPGRHTSILIARGAGFRSGLRVDRVVDVIDVPEDAIAPPLDTAAPVIKSVGSGTILHTGRAATVLDVDALYRLFLGDQETQQ